MDWANAQSFKDSDANLPSLVGSFKDSEPLVPYEDISSKEENEDSKTEFVHWMVSPKLT